MHLRRENSTATIRSGAPHHAALRHAFAGVSPSGGNGLRDSMTETQNVSARGVFFYLDRPLAEGTRIEVTMTFPPHVTLTEPVRVRFTARVVRVENLASLFRALAWPR